MLKILLITLSCLTVSCSKDYDYCTNCSNQYPHYNDSHLRSSAQPINTLPPPPRSSKAKIETLSKVIVFPVSNKRKTAVGFADAFLTALEKKGWKVLDSDTQFRNGDPIIDIKNSTGIEKPDIVAFYMTEMSETNSSKNFHAQWEQLSKANFLKVSILEDFNFPWQINNASYFSQYADVILVRYPEAFQQIIPDCKKPVFHFPHSAGRSYFQEKSDFSDKEPTALLSGSINERWYPLRSKARELFHAGKKIITFREHPGYQPGADPVQEAKDYAAQISKNQLALTGAGMGVALAAPYILAKHFEIPATGTVMITDKFVAPLMQNLGFIENVHFLASTPDTLERDLERWLAPENKAALEQIGLAGQKLVAERHSLEKRVEEFEKVVYHSWSKKRQETIGM